MKMIPLSFCLLLCLGAGIFAQEGGEAAHEFDEALRVVEAWLDAQVDYQQIPGISASFVVDQELVWTYGTGKADLETGLGMTDSTIFSICSISKLFTSIGIMQLRDQGLLDLDDDIHEHLPWLDLRQAFPQGGPLTIRALLTHAAGVPRDGIPPYWADADFPFPSREEFKEGLSSQQTLFRPFEAYQYSNLGISLLGLVIEELSGKSYEDYMRERVIRYLGMKDTRPEMPEQLRKDRLATGYGVISREGSREELNFFQPGGIAPAAGFSSTARDMALFGQWNFKALEVPENPLLNGNTLREMQRIQYMDPAGNTTRGLGYGVYRDRDLYLVGHAGSCPGYLTQFKLDTKRKWGVVLMVNTQGVSDSNLMYGVFKILESYDRNKPVEEEEGLDLEEYAGIYYDLWDGESIIVPWKGRLAAFSLRMESQRGPSAVMEHVEGDRFKMLRKDGGPETEVRFERDASGKVTRQWVHSFYTERIR